MKQFFVWLCIFCAVFIFTTMTFLELDYVSDDTFEISDLNGDPVSVNYLSIPIQRYLDDNQADISHFEYTIQDKFYSAERLGNDLYSTAKGFIGFFDDFNLDITSNDPLSPAYLYANNSSYRLFVNSYISNLQKAYQRADFGFWKRVVLGFGDQVNNVRDSLVSSVTYDPYFSRDLVKPIFSLADEYPLMITDPYLYFVQFNVNPQYHISVQPLLLSYGVDCFVYIDTDISIQTNIHPVVILYCRREADPDAVNGFNVVFERRVSTNYVYNSSIHSVYKES